MDGVAIDQDDRPTGERTARFVVLGFFLVGLGLVIDQALTISATYDEPTYVRVAARWLRSGNDDAISRMGSPRLFWKLQVVPVLLMTDRAGFPEVADQPDRYLPVILPLVRIWSTIFWAAAFFLTVTWARLLAGHWAAAFSAALFAMSPNLSAHGALVTTEMPIVAGSTATFLAFWLHLETGLRRYFWLSAVCAGIAFCLKFTAVVFPPILAVCLLIDALRTRGARTFRRVLGVVAMMLGFVAIMLGLNLVLGGFKLLPMSTGRGDHPYIERLFGHGRLSALVGAIIEAPIPADWAGFLTQSRFQSEGGPSYLLGETRLRGWWYFYPIALAVKSPLALWGLLLLAVPRIGGAEKRRGATWFLPVVVVLFLAIAMSGSKRNYGVRYLLPMAPVAIAWISRSAAGSKARRRAAWALLGGFAIAVVSIHPFELTYFNALAGGARGGRRLLSDSNLDWGQGLKQLAELRRKRPELGDLTLYYFGDIDPEVYVVGCRGYVVDALPRSPIPPRFRSETRYVAVSVSLIWGSWGPPGYFNSLASVEPVCFTEDGTIAVYEADSVPGLDRAPIVERPE